MKVYNDPELNVVQLAFEAVAAEDDTDNISQTLDFG